MTSPVDTSVKIFNEGQPGAPTLPGQVGSLIPVLKACLVTGYGLRACSITVLDGVATATVTADSKNLTLPLTVQLIAGVAGGMTNAADLNGEQKIVSATSTTLKFNCPTVADGTATGTITVKHAPLGWEEVFTGANKSVFRATDVTGNRFFLRVDDTMAQYAMVRGYTSMTDIDTGSGAFPLPAEILDMYSSWQKSMATSATATNWSIQGNGKIFYFSSAPYMYASPDYKGMTTYAFGDVLKYRSTDAFATVLWSSPNPGTGFTAGNVWTMNVNSTIARWARGFNGLGEAVNAWLGPLSGAVGATSGKDGNTPPFPSDVDGSLRLCGIQLSQNGAVLGSTARYRGEFPGLKYCMHSNNVGQFYARGSTIVDEGRTYLAQTTSDWATPPNEHGVGFVDVTGPW